MIIYQTTMDTVTSQPFNRETFVTKKTSSRISFVHLSLKICFISFWKRRKTTAFSSRLLEDVTSSNCCIEQLLSFLKSIASQLIHLHFKNCWHHPAGGFGWMVNNFGFNKRCLSFHCFMNKKMLIHTILAMIISACQVMHEPVCKG